MHQISGALASDRRPALIGLCRHFARKFDGAYSIVFLDALGNMMIARDPLGIKPLSYAVEGPLFAAASESVALLNVGFAAESIKSVPPGHAITISDGRLDVRSFYTPHARALFPRSARSRRRAHCFFEWVYFANVASTLDDRSVYLARKALGEELARLETVPIDEDTVVVPVPDTSKAAADAMAYALKVPCVEGLDPQPLQRPDVHRGQRQPPPQGRDEVHAAARSAGRQAGAAGRGLDRPRHDAARPAAAGSGSTDCRGKIHVRVACPPIISPCFYGIDMSTVGELFAPRFLQGGPLTPEVEARMAAQLGADSLRYLPVEAVARAIRIRTRASLPRVHHRQLSHALRPTAGPVGDGQLPQPRRRADLRDGRGQGRGERD